MTRVGPTRTIAIFDDRPQGVYGAKQTSLSIAEGLSERGMDALIVSTGEGPFLEEARRRRLRVLVVPVWQGLAVYDRGLMRGSPGQLVRRALALAGANIRIARALRNEGVRLVIANSVRSVLQLGGTRVVTDGVLWYVQIAEDLGVATRVAGRIATHRIGLSDRVSVTSGGLDAIVPLGVDLRPYTYRSQNLGTGADLVLTVSAFLPRKGLVDNVRAIHAAQQLLGRPLRYRIVGAPTSATEAAHHDDVLSLAEELGVHLELPGWSDSVDLELRAADALLHLAHVEGTPRAIIEAMAVGVPVVASGAGGTSDLVVHGLTGYLAEDSDDAGQYLADLLRDERKRRALGEAAAAQARARHDLGKMVEAFCSIVDQELRS